MRKRQQVQRRWRDILLDVCDWIYHFRGYCGRYNAHDVFALPPRAGLRWHEQVDDLHSRKIQPWQQQRVPGMWRRQSLQWIWSKQLQHVRSGFIQLSGKLQNTPRLLAVSSRIVLHGGERPDAVSCRQVQWGGERRLFAVR